MLDNVNIFLEKIFLLLENNGIDLTGLEIDHLCYRTTSLENYEEIKKRFLELGNLLVESEVGGRDIATFKLETPITYRGFKIGLVEVPAPKRGKTTLEGWEHIEIVTKESFEDLIQKYHHLNLETKALSKNLNPELAVKFEDCCIKFHHQSLEEVIRIEKELANA